MLLYSGLSCSSEKADVRRLRRQRGFSSEQTRATKWPRDPLVRCTGRQETVWWTHFRFLLLYSDTSVAFGYVSDWQSQHKQRRNTKAKKCYIGRFLRNVDKLDLQSSQAHTKGGTSKTTTIWWWDVWVTNRHAFTLVLICKITLPPIVQNTTICTQHVLQKKNVTFTKDLRYL